MGAKDGGCDARDAIGVNANQRQNWRVDTTAEQWLDECISDGTNTSGGSGTGYNFHASTSTAKIHLSGYRGAVLPTSIEPNNVSTIDLDDAGVA